MEEKVKTQNPKETTEKTETALEKSKNVDAHLTISTKMSTDQLICKTPQESPSVSVQSLRRGSNYTKHRSVLYLGSLQVFFGFFMMVFGIFVIVHKASLGQLAGGIWGGLLAMATGISGVLASAEGCCPFKSTAQKVAHTVFLALSLISLAISQLIVVIAATGLARDINSVEIQEGNLELQASKQTEKITLDIPENYQGILYNIGLIVASSLECVCATFAAYRSSRELCPCFRKTNEEHYQDNLNIHRSHAIVSSWLGKNNVNAPQIYVVTGPTSTLGRGSKISNVTPIYAIPTPMVQPQMVGYPLIPAPLGQIPSPIIPPPRREMISKVHKRYKSKSKSRSREPTPARRSRSKSKSKERQVTEADMVRTYTGLDRTIAEEFIEICDSKNTSLCSDISCSNSSCRSPCNCKEGCNNTISDTASQEYLINKI